MTIALFQNHTQSLPSQLDPRTKLGISLLMFILIFWIMDIILLCVILVFILSLSILTQGWKSTSFTIWYLKWYLLAFFAFFVVYSSDTDLLILTLIKLLGFVFSFVVLSKTTDPDQLVDALIKLKLPSSLAWNIGVAIRQATFLLDEIAHILEIQRQRTDLHQSGIFQHFKSRIYEIYILLQSLISRSVVISTDFTDALQARGYKKPHKAIITYSSSFGRLDLIFIFTYIFFPLTILSLISHQFFIVDWIT